jgi:hypothetical protein
MGKAPRCGALFIRFPPPLASLTLRDQLLAMDDDFVGNDFLAKRQWNHLAQILKGSSPGL